MATIILEGVAQTKGGGQKNQTSRTGFSQSATVATVPDRYHYATVAGVARTFERVGKDASGNWIYRDQRRY